MTPATTDEEARNIIDLPVILNDTAPRELRAVVKGPLIIVDSWIDMQYGHCIAVRSKFVDLTTTLKINEVTVSKTELH